MTHATFVIALTEMGSVYFYNVMGQVQDKSKYYSFSRIRINVNEA